MRSPLIDLVAVAYNAPNETARFLASLDQVGVPFTLTVVENFSPDPQVRRVLEQARETITRLPDCVGYMVLEQGQNLGYATACNLGAALGHADYLALLNCDTAFTDGTVPAILEHFAANPTTGVVGPRTVDSQGHLTHAGIVHEGASGRDQHRGWLETDTGQFVDTLRVPTVSGATYFVRRSTWDELTGCPLYMEIAQANGAFLPTQHFYEETWCSYHARAHDWAVVYLGQVTMIHEWHKSSPIGSIALLDAEDYFRKACANHGIELTF